MTSNSTKSASLQSEAETTVRLLDDWFDPIEAGLRDRVREFIQAMIESELETALARPRYGRRPTADIQNGDGPGGISGHRHGHRSCAFLSTGATWSCFIARHQDEVMAAARQAVGVNGANAGGSAGDERGVCIRHRGTPPVGGSHIDDDRHD